MKRLLVLSAAVLLGTAGVVALAQKLDPTTGIMLVIPTSSGGSTTPSAPSTVVTVTAKGLTLTTGGTSQVIATANASRKTLVIQNPCTLTSQGIAAAENLFVNINAAATVSTNVNFAELQPCQSLTLSVANGYVDQEAVQVNAATTGHIIYAKEF